MNNNRLGLRYLFCLAGLSAAAGAMATPVTQPAAPDPLLQREREQELAALQSSQMPGQLQGQSLRTDAGAAAIATATNNSAALLDLGKQAGAEFEAVLGKADLLQGAGLRPARQAEQELFGGASKEGLISAEVKSVVKDLRGELHQLTGDHFRNAQAAGEAEQAQLNRRLDEARSARAEAADSAGRPISAVEHRVAAGRAALMTEQLIEEIKPWAITAASLFLLFQIAQALVRKQAAAKLLRGKMRRELHRTTSDPALPEQPLPAKGQRVRVRQRIRLSSPGESPGRSSSSRRHRF